MNPFDYSLCSQTVTLYARRNGRVLRRVADNCYLAPRQGITEDLTGKSRPKAFLLIIPGEADLQPGDRVYDGIGPEEIAWETFAPAFTDRLYEIGYVKPCYWDGAVCHVQAGQQ